MFQIAVDASDFLRRTGELVDRHLPQIEVWAVNWTAQDATDALRDRMKVVFDRPTRWTLNAFMVWRATKGARIAEIRRKDGQARRHYLEVQDRGGPRQQTALEKLLESRVVTDRILRTVIPATAGPFEGARLDAYGNWSSGERNQVLSALGAQRDARSNSTARSRKRARNRATYFVPKRGLAPGVYRRKGADDIPVRILKFSSKAPMYRPELDFEGTVSRIYQEKLGANLKRAFDRALGQDI